MIRKTRIKLKNIWQTINGLDNQSTFYLGNGVALTKLFTGQHIYVDTNDISVAPHLMIAGRWEPEITDVWIGLVEENSVIFDVGANFGYFGLVAGGQLSSNRPDLHFFEANPKLIPFINRSCSINGLRELSKVNQVAISDKAGSLELSVFEDYIGSSRLGETTNTSVGFEVSEKVGVKSITLDSYVRDNKIKTVDLIKIDVEGFEEKVYKGMKNIIKKNPGLRILLEFTDHEYDDSKKFFEKMQSDFKHVYAIKGSNNLVTLNSYKQLKKLANNDWIMLVLSNSTID
jgi:FkbM family methyltransferase